MDFPRYRPRRMRRNEKIRSLVRETHLAPTNLIYPLFVGPGKDKAQPVSSMPGVAQLSVDRAVDECVEANALGIPAVILFGLPEKKDALGSEAYDDGGVVQQAIRAIKDALRDFWMYSSPKCAEKYFNSWYFWATHSRMAPIIGAAKTLKRHLANLLTYFKHRITNATAEGINSKIQMVKLMACGYRNRDHYRAAIYFHCGGLDLNPRPEAP